ncbi:MAG: flavodoxin family protein [Peptococcaceae bacterium]|nr:flavodoxin family protein [Peptococcaceae bacterium]
MKVVAFNGSPRKNGNTAQAIRVVLEELESQGIATEFIQLGGTNVHGCRACMRCAKNKDGRCSWDDDDMNIFIDKMREADGIIIGSPVYFSNVTAEVKALIERAGFVALRNGNFLRRKVGAAVVVMRRAGGTFTYAAINYFFGITEMIVPASNYWNLGVGLSPGEVQKDEEGIETFRTLGRNMAWLLKTIK